MIHFTLQRKLSASCPNAFCFFRELPLNGYLCTCGGGCLSDGICEHAFVKDCILVMRSGLCNEEKVSPKTNKKKIHLLKVRAGARRSEIFRELQSSKLNSNMTSGPENYFPWEKAGSSSCETFKGSLFILKWHLWMNHFCHFSQKSFDYDNRQNDCLLSTAC